MKKQSLFLYCVIFLTACSSTEAVIPTTTLAKPTDTAVALLSTNTSIPPTATTTATSTPEPLPSATIAPTATSTEETVAGIAKPFFDVSGLTLEHEIDPECVGQFPIIKDSHGFAVVAVTYDNLLLAKDGYGYSLGENIEVLVSIEAWVNDHTPIIIPAAIWNKETNEIWTQGNYPRSFPEAAHEAIFEASEEFWKSTILQGNPIKPGDALNITFMVSKDGLLINNPVTTTNALNTNPTSFETAPITEEELLPVLNGDFSTTFRNITWPLFNIQKRQ